MNSKKALAAIAISAMLLSGCGFKKDVIVKVDDQVITQSDFNKAFDEATNNSMFAQMGVDVKKDKNGFLYLMLKDKVVNELIVKALVNEELAKRKIDVTNADVETEYKNIVDKIGSKEKFDEILKQNNMPFSKFKNELKDELKMRKLAATVTKINVTEADAKKFYNQNLNKFKYPDKVRASHILIAANAGEIKAKLLSDPANKKLSESEIQAKVDKEMAIKLEKAKKILAEVKKDPSAFAKIAKENSEDLKSAKQGGDLGFFAANEMVQPFSKAAFAQKPNTISNIVQSPSGYHIILVTDRMKAGQEPFAKVKNDIIFYLVNKKNVEVIDKLLDSTKAKAKIVYVKAEYDPAKIQNLLKQQAKSNPNAKEEVNPEAQSATPAPITKKK